LGPKIEFCTNIILIFFDQKSQKLGLQWTVLHNLKKGHSAVAVALGQDFRAIEAAAHAWATRSGKYQPLTHYRLVKVDGVLNLEGNIELPVPIGVRGGSVQSHPAMEFTHGLLSNPTCAEVGEILASVGLAQNFAALRALSEVASYMIAIGNISVASAQDYLKNKCDVINMNINRI